MIKLPLATASVALLAGCVLPGPGDLLEIDTAAHRNVSRIVLECKVHLAIKGPVKLGELYTCETRPQVVG